MQIVTKAVHDSIQHALDYREQALDIAMQFARDLDSRLANRFVSMYVNDRTLDYGADGRAAIHKLLDLGYERRPHRRATSGIHRLTALRPRVKPI